ncbi:hypothetical protein E2562_018557 [Oryza meyeriana var. granulata]|uniref:Uncharacterized protein n=1 Tax=Oryza meyeriana var. granulata TaxID=110450 RepID=A0A6G1F9H2_9ORYZ|nr:hypothetical protein E2562_018557 [Oryza meyeriana var. granulata]
MSHAIRSARTSHQWTEEVDRARRRQRTASALQGSPAGSVETDKAGLAESKPTQQLAVLCCQFPASERAMDRAAPHGLRYDRYHGTGKTSRVARASGMSETGGSGHMQPGR